MSRLTSIIIPTCNGREWLADCLYSIRAHTGSPYEIIVIDNGSTDGTADFLRNEGVIFVSLSANRGFPAACNIGLRLSRGGSVLLLNDDVIVGPKWLDNLLACLNREASTGIVGPMTNYASGRQQTQEPYTSLEHMSGRYDRQYKGQQEEVNRIVGLCMLMKRELLTGVGLLDERFSPGHYEDDDYCYRARMAGYRLMIARDTFIYHRGSASFGKEGQVALNKLVLENRLKFIEKWQVDPLSLY